MQYSAPGPRARLRLPRAIPGVGVWRQVRTRLSLRLSLRSAAMCLVWVAALALWCAACSEPPAGPVQGAATAQSISLLAGHALLDATEFHMSGQRDGQPYHLLRQGDGSFRLMSPIRDTAESKLLAGIAAVWARCKVVVDDAPPADKVIGLDYPLGSLTVRFGDQEVRVEFGKLVDSKSKRNWVRVDRAVGQVAAEALTCLMVEQEALRARALFATFPYTKVTVTTATRSATLQRDKTKDAWKWADNPRDDNKTPTADAGACIDGLRKLSVASFRYGAPVDRGTPTARCTLDAGASTDDLRLWALPDGRWLAAQSHRDLEVFVELPAVLRELLR